MTTVRARSSSPSATWMRRAVCMASCWVWSRTWTGRTTSASTSTAKTSVWIPTGHAKGMSGPVGYWHVDDIHATVAALVDAGAEPVQDVTDVGGGKLIATVNDADDNVVGVLQHA